jgi:hypothetical protein
MKQSTTLLVAGLVTLLSGCATNYVVAWKARPHFEFDKQQQQDVHVAGHPAYYALLPLSVPFDIVTSPIQLCVLLAWPAPKTDTLTNRWEYGGYGTNAPTIIK